MKKDRKTYAKKIVQTPADERKRGRREKYEEQGQ